jgi:hypothetical protein
MSRLTFGKLQRTIRKYWILLILRAI